MRFADTRPFPHPLDERQVVPDRARSEEAFPVENLSNRHVVIRATTFTDNSELQSRCISNTQLVMTHSKDLLIGRPTVGIGQLDRLPTELIWRILPHLDLASLDSLRQVNRRAREIAITLPELCRIAKVAGNVLLALVATELAQYWTIHDVDDVLLTETCECGEYASLVFLPALTKVCLPCLQTPMFRSDLRLWTINSDKLRARLEKSNLHPIMHTLAGHYGKEDEGEEREYRERYFCTTGGSTIKSVGMYDRSPYSAAITMPYVDGAVIGAGRKVCHGVRCRGCKSQSEKLPSSDDESHPGWEQWRIQQLAERRYSFEGYLEHFRWCLEAQQIWLQCPEYTSTTAKPDDPLAIDGLTTK